MEYLAYSDEIGEGHLERVLVPVPQDDPESRDEAQPVEAGQVGVAGRGDRQQALTVGPGREADQDARQEASSAPPRLLPVSRAFSRDVSRTVSPCLREREKVTKVPLTNDVIPYRVLSSHTSPKHYQILGRNGHVPLQLCCSPLRRVVICVRPLTGRHGM